MTFMEGHDQPTGPPWDYYMLMGLLFGIPACLVLIGIWISLLLVGAT